MRWMGELNYLSNSHVEPTFLLDVKKLNVVQWINSIPVVEENQVVHMLSVEAVRVGAMVVST